jgi:hypothetical protein
MAVLVLQEVSVLLITGSSASSGLATESGQQRLSKQIDDTGESFSELLCFTTRCLCKLTRCASAV